MKPTIYTLGLFWCVCNLSIHTHKDHQMLTKKTQMGRILH
jgi:hypothetical protein